MNAIDVVLTGTSPTLHNRLWSDGTGWTPESDAEQAESRLHIRCGRLYLPGRTMVVAIGRAAWSRGLHGPAWPRDLRHAQSCASLRVADVAFAGEWEPQVFLRRDLPPIALPRFDRWTASFTLEYDQACYFEGTLTDLLEYSGRHLGLPQFAPFAGPGPWGRFDMTAWRPLRVGRAETARV